MNTPIARPALPAPQWLRPLLNRLTMWWSTSVGPAGWGAVALLAAAALLQWQVLPRLQRDQGRLLMQLRAPAAQNPNPDGLGTTRSSIEVLQALPPIVQRGSDVEFIVNAARTAQLTLDRADYATPAEGVNGASRLQATLPVSGTYPDVRRFIAAVLNDLPNSALESLQIERPDAKSTQVNATVRFVLFYRRDEP